MDELSNNSSNQHTAQTQPSTGSNYPVLEWTEIPQYSGTREYPCPRVGVGWTRDLTWPYEDDGLPNI